MPQSLANLHIHLIFSTKERFPYLTAEARPDLHACMATVLANRNSPAVLTQSVADHVHSLFNLGRTVTLAQAVEDVKSHLPNG
ncbi:MAG: transposase [Prosthecobacter sp.]|jgi:putative transposase|uniref:transposase n=1 Tax=Prosthecobacter sp. TaxID=1965333 RepID=UPI001A102F01|nr:transposase [Prosthecobacter sp.]MBE2287821.1 transposase [Prosthecobacter sp.]